MRETRAIDTGNSLADDLMRATGSERLLVCRQGKQWVAIYGDPAHPAQLVAPTRSQVVHLLERLMAAAA